MQLEDWFTHNDRNPLDDSEFVPIMDMLIESFAHAGVGAPGQDIYAATPANCTIKVLPGSGT